MFKLVATLSTFIVVSVNSNIFFASFSSSSSSFSSFFFFTFYLVHNNTTLHSTTHSHAALTLHYKPQPFTHHFYSCVSTFSDQAAMSFQNSSQSFILCIIDLFFYDLQTHFVCQIKVEFFPLACKKQKCVSSKSRTRGYHLGTFKSEISITLFLAICLTLPAFYYSLSLSLSLSFSVFL